MSERNVLGGELEPCGLDPLTGFHRDGTCTVGPQDVGLPRPATSLVTEAGGHQRKVQWRRGVHR